MIFRLHQPARRGKADDRLWHEFPGLVTGRARQLCPGNSDLDFLGYLKGVVDLDPQVANGAFDLGVPQQ